MIRTIPLNKLVQSPRNVRKHSDAAADAELAGGEDQGYGAGVILVRSKGMPSSCTLTSQCSMI